jgi:hypothetical protein
VRSAGADPSGPHRVHELVHARVSEENAKLPLWFEEGLASLFGDGALYDGA